MYPNHCCLGTRESLLINLIPTQAREDEINQMRQDTTRLNKMRENIQRKLQQVEESKSEVEGQKETLKSQIGGLERGNIF